LIQAERLDYVAPGGTKLLRNIGLAVKAGERVGILGPSGSGKSTLAFHLCGLHALALPGRTSGTLRLEGRDALGGGRRGFAGLVLQNPTSQLFGRTVEEEVGLGLRGSEAPKRLEHALVASGLAERRTQEVATLSLGWKQRLSIAGMLAMDPRVLFLDEPTNYLDESTASNLFERLRGLEGTTLLVADHDERRLAGWADRILRIEEGVLVQDIPARNFTPQPPLASRIPEGTPGEGLLELENVTFAYQKGVPVLENLSLSLREGETVALLGPNGSGKTTLLRLAKGLLQPRSGAVRLASGGDPMREVGLVFQNPDDALFAPTVVEEAAFLPTNLGLDRPQVRALEALDRLGIAALAGRAPFTLSYGEKRRLTLASVLSGEGRILCLDEPTIGLDRANLGILADLLSGYVRRGGAVLFATHDEAFAAAVATRTVRLGAVEAVA